MVEAEHLKDYTITLDTDGSSWLRVCHLPDSLAAYGARDFDAMFDCHPHNRAKVIMPSGEVTCKRWQQSYLQTPTWNPELKTSYMFSGMNPPDPDPELPARYRIFLDYMNNGKEHYNQMTVNWYQDGHDFIASHSDYTCNAVPGSDIAIITLNRPESSSSPPRIFRLQPKATTLDSVVPKVEIELSHGCIIIMGGATQHKFRHSVPKQPQAAARISITLRSYETAATAPAFAAALAQNDKDVDQNVAEVKN